MTDQELQQVRDIVREEMGKMTDRQVISSNLQILDARNIQVGRTTGTKIGTAIDQKIGFFGQTPVDKPETVADTGGADATAVNAIIDRLQELGLIK